RASTIPVLTFRPRKGAEGGPPLARILVGLDGSDRAEASLPYAVALAQHLKLPLTLTQVVPSEVELFPGPNYVDYPDDIVAELIANAGEYLDKHARKLDGEGIVCDTKVEVGFPATQLIGVANRQPGTLIVLSSHGRPGLDRALLGDVTGRVIHESHWPVLVIRAPSTES
ncbi:MAG: universal stress protein, partial [Chloroflexota bacterium]